MWGHYVSTEDILCPFIDCIVICVFDIIDCMLSAAESSAKSWKSGAFSGLGAC